MQKQQYGFTLIEMMIVVAVIGILAAIAYPSYQRYVIKTKRTDMMTELQNIASRIESQKLAMGGYTAVPLASVLGGTPSAGNVAYPATNALYEVSIWDMSLATPAKMIGANLASRQWQISAIPRATAQMANDGRLTLDSQGIKCRDKNNDGDTQDSGECGSNAEWQDN